MQYAATVDKYVSRYTRVKIIDVIDL